MKAVVVASEDKSLAIKDVHVPVPGEGQVLIKVVTAAQNPTDWKTVERFSPVGAIVGVDFAGTIAELGPGVDGEKLKIGDRVASFIRGGVGPIGSYAEYLVAPTHMLIRLPDKFTFENAAQLGVSAFTTAQVLWESQTDLPKISFDGSGTSLKPVTLLVWSGASSTGHYVIQFAKLAGMKVITTSSSKHFDRLKKLGADEVFDYNDPDVAKKIREATGNKLKYAVDCISEDTTYDKVSESLGSEGGIISCILPYKQELRSGVEARLSLAYNLLGDTTPQRAGRQEDKDFGAWAADLTSKILASGKFVPLPVNLMPNGLESVNEGFKYMKEGKVSGEKITYRISDTPGL